MLRETPILKAPTFVRIVGVSLCPRFLKLTAALYLQSFGCSMQLLLNFTPISSSHSSPICFHPAPCIEIRDSRDVHFIYFSPFLLKMTERILFSFPTPFVSLS